MEGFSAGEDGLRGPGAPAVQPVAGDRQLVGDRAGARRAGGGPGRQGAADGEDVADLWGQVGADGGEVLVRDLLEADLAGRGDDDQAAGDLVGLAERDALPDQPL